MHRNLVIVATVMALATAADAQVFNKCVSGKALCVAKKTQALLKCEAKAAKLGVDPTTDSRILACLQKAKDKFEGTGGKQACFAKVEAKANPSKPETICITTGDIAAMEAKVDAFVADVIGALETP
jgi:hypothetical protein